MAIHPVNDRLKIEVQKNEYGFGEADSGAESGIVVEVPDVLIYLSFHSFAFEKSILNNDVLAEVQAYYNTFLGKKVYWESLQERGRRMTEQGKDYVYLQMTDLLAYADSPDDDGEIVSSVGSAGSFNL